MIIKYWLDFSQGLGRMLSGVLSGGLADGLAGGLAKWLIRYSPKCLETANCRRYRPIFAECAGLHVRNSATIRCRPFLTSSTVRKAPERRQKGVREPGTIALWWMITFCTIVAANCIDYGRLTAFSKKNGNVAKLITFVFNTNSSHRNSNKIPIQFYNSQNVQIISINWVFLIEYFRQRCQISPACKNESPVTNFMDDSRVAYVIIFEKWQRCQINYIFSIPTVPIVI